MPTLLLLLAYSFPFGALVAQVTHQGLERGLVGSRIGQRRSRLMDSRRLRLRLRVWTLPAIRRVVLGQAPP